MKVGINGMGRIGRLALRAAMGVQNDRPAPHPDRGVVHNQLPGPDREGGALHKDL
jgi:hypothetical protein